MEDLRWLDASLRRDSNAPEPKYPVRIERWIQLCWRYPFLWTLFSKSYSECAPPGPMPSGEFRKLVGAFRDTKQGNVLAEMILELIGPEIIKLIKAANPGRKKK